MTLDSYFYIEYLGIEVWSYFHGWQESMTGTYLTREIGMYHLNIQISLFVLRIKMWCEHSGVSYMCMLHISLKANIYLFFWSLKTPM